MTTTCFYQTDPTSDCKAGAPDGPAHDGDLLQALQDGEHGRQGATPLDAPRDGDAAADRRDGAGQLAARRLRLQVGVLHTGAHPTPSARIAVRLHSRLVFRPSAAYCVIRALPSQFSTVPMSKLCMHQLHSATREKA